MCACIVAIHVMGHYMPKCFDRFLKVKVSRFYFDCLGVCKVTNAPPT